MFLRWLFPVLVVLSACGNLSSRLETPDVEKPNQSTPVENGGDAGENPKPDPKQEPDAGPGVVNPSPPVGELTWAKLVSPVTSEHHAVAGRGSGADLTLYLTVGHGNIYRLESGRWTPVFKSPTNSTFRHLWVAPDGAVFAAGDRFATCRSRCTQPSDFTETAATLSVHGLCGVSSTEVYASGVGTSTNTGQMAKYDGTGWSMLSNNTGSFFNKACWVSPTGDVFIAAQSKMVRFDGLAFTPEPFDYPVEFSEVPHMMFEGIHGSGSRIFAVGARRRIAERGTDGRWRFAFNPNGVGGYTTILSTMPHEFLAVGDGYQADQRLARFDGFEWKYVADSPALSTYGGWAASEREYYIVGVTPGTLQGVIFRGSR